jgi:4-carboxymuconolactone decarboxylase
MKANIFLLMIMISLLVPALTIGSEGKNMETHHALDQRQQGIIPIAAFTAEGDINHL